jgi:uncharacterized protein (DUF1697 family)
MNTFISMLRGINVGARKTIRMAELKGLYEGLGLIAVKTYVQSGNVVFASPEADPAALADSIESQIAQTFDFAVSVFVRRPDEFAHILAANPFLSERNEDPARLHVTFLHHTPSGSELNGLPNPNAADDEFFLSGRDVYLFCPNGYGKTKLSNNFFERKFGQPATTRNWNTVNALYALAVG